MLPWLILSIAIVLEVAGTTAMKLSAGFTRLGPSLVVFVCYIGAIVALTLALKKIEIGVAYAIWAGVGTALIALIGILYFNESLTTIKMVSILLIIVGVVGLSLAGQK